MKIECTKLYEFDEIGERKRINKNFKGETKTSLLLCLDHFTAFKWSEAADILRSMRRDDLDYVSPFIFDRLRDFGFQKSGLNAGFDQAHFDALPEENRILSGEDGSPVSVFGLDYPKFKILEAVDLALNNEARNNQPIKALRRKP